MIETLFLSAALLATQPTGSPASPAPSQRVSPPAPAPDFSQEERARLRCAAAFSIAAARQPGGELAVRGKEFFVITLAALMERHQLDRDAVTKAVLAEANALVAAGEVDAVMPACLMMLGASGV